MLLRHTAALSVIMITGILLSCAPSNGGDLSDTEKLSAVYAMYDGYKEDFPDVSDISPAEAMKLLSIGRAVFIDTRTPAEMAVSTLPGAITEKEYYDTGIGPPGNVAIAYCTISYRSGLFSAKESSKGAPVRNLRGGLLAWVLEGGKVYDSSGKETRRIHVYGRRWDYPPAGYRSEY